MIALLFIRKMYRIFNEIDKNKDGSISTVELRVFVIGIQLQEDGAIKEDYIKRVMEQMDISVVDRINEDEFVTLFSKWLKVAKKTVAKADTKPRSFLSRLKVIRLNFIVLVLFLRYTQCITSIISDKFIADH